MTAHFPTRAVLSEVRDPFEMAERARWAEIAKRNALTPAQAKARDAASGYFEQPFDDRDAPECADDRDPYFLGAFR